MSIKYLLFIPPQISHFTAYLCISLLDAMMRRSIFPVYRDARRRLILALESSADDTCAAIVSSEREILSNVVLKQDQIHEQYGGIHPLYATQGHMRNISTAISEAIRRSGVAFGELDAIATTEGPGMKGCLQIAMVAAKSLVGMSGLPLIGVHHMQAHALTCCLTEQHRYSPSTRCCAAADIL